MSHLVLSRKPGESVLIGDDIVVTIVQNKSNNQVKVAIDAPRHITVLREELVPTKLVVNRRSSNNI